MSAGRTPGPDLPDLPDRTDLPRGSRLLDVVAVMDRLRSPGGCPWDARQTHASLVKYLLEEAYEVADSVGHGDRAALREELGDVLLQVVFHARIAEEDPDQPWDIDDVADGLVHKLVRRHPHVFSDTEVRDADEVSANWDRIKAREKGRVSVTEGVPMAQPALSLYATLWGRAERGGLVLQPVPVPPKPVPAEPDATEPAPPEADAVGAQESAATARDIGLRLAALVCEAVSNGVDPEAALRDQARDLRERILHQEAEESPGDPRG